MDFCLLGPLVVRCSGVVVPVRQATQRAVLAALLLDAGQVVPTGELAEALWGPAPPSSSSNVTIRNYIKRLRQTLGEAGRARISTGPRGYRISVEPGELDVLRFEAALKAARAAERAGSWDQAAAHARSALSLWRGQPLADVESEVLAQRELPRLAELRLQALETRIGADLHLGSHADVINDLRQLVAAHPLREHLHALLVLALYQGDRQAEALAAYRHARRLLAEELGIEPGAELRTLHARILAGDSASAEPPRAQAESRAAADRGPAAVPRQLPAASPHFTGRTDALKDLNALAGGDPDTAVPIAVIDGTAGVGKTALALHWGRHAAESYPDGQLYVNLRGFDPGGRPTPPVEALRGFLYALGVPLDRTPLDLEGCAGLYRSLLAGRRMLIVLDNARDADQVRPLLPGGANCLVLVTSRSQLAGLVAVEGARALTLDLLTAAEAHELLARRLGAERVAREPAAAAQLVELCARLPLALNIAAARAEPQSGSTLGGLAEELRDARDRLTVLDAGDTFANVRAVFWWSYRASDPAAGRMFRHLGLHAGPDISVAAAASLTGTGREEARDALRSLTRAHLLTEHAPGRYAFHDLLRAYAVEQALVHDTEDERREATHRMLDHYLRTADAAAQAINPAREPVVLQPSRPGTAPEAHRDGQQAVAWLEAERHVLLAAIPHAAETGFDTYVCGLAWALVTFLTRQGHWHELTATQHAALAAARRLHDPTEQARAHRALGRALTYTGSYPEAHKHLQYALQIYQDLEDSHGVANIHSGIAWALEREGHVDEALEHALLAQAAHQAARDPIGQARDLNTVGWYLCLLGEHDRALTYCQQSLDLYKELNDERGEANTWDSLGYAHHHLKHYTQAMDCYNRALALYRKIRDFYLEAVILTHAGETHLAMGERGRARAEWEEALAVFSRLDQPDAEEVLLKLRSLDEEPARTPA